MRPPGNQRLTCVVKDSSVSSGLKYAERTPRGTRHEYAQRTIPGNGKPITEMYPVAGLARMRAKQNTNRLRQTAGEVPTNLLCTQLEGKDTAGAETRAWIMAGDARSCQKMLDTRTQNHRHTTYLCRRHSPACEDSCRHEDSIVGTEALAQSRESDSLWTCAEMDERAPIRRAVWPQVYRRIVYSPALGFDSCRSTSRATFCKGGVFVTFRLGAGTD